MNGKDNNALINAIKSGEHPRYLYRYIPINPNTICSLKENYLWFSKIKDFNDPYEGDVLKDHNYTEIDLRRFIEERRSILTTFDIQQLSTDPEAYIEKGMSDAYNGATACCFSMSNDNMLMWSHYADKHQGICLEFDILRDTTNVFRMLCQVKYTNTRESCNYIRDSFSYLRCFALTKSTDWSYEKEYRAIYPELEDQRFPYNINMLKRVIFGCKTKGDDINLIKSILPKTVAYSKCKLNNKEYKIDIVNI